MTKSTKTKPAVTPAKRQTKAALVEGLLAHEEGATLEAMCKATGWLPHTCRAFLTGLRKKGKTVALEKRKDGASIYRLGPEQQSIDGSAAPTAGAAA